MQFAHGPKLGEPFMPFVNRILHAKAVAQLLELLLALPMPQLFISVITFSMFLLFTTLCFKLLWGFLMFFYCQEDFF